MNTFFSALLAVYLLPFTANAAMQESYNAPLWLPGGDLQTIYAATLANMPEIMYQRARWELPDGDFVDVDWTVTEKTDDQQPVVVLFHGLEGNSQSAYAKLLMAEVNLRGWRGVVIHFRGCSGEPNRLPRVYYAGDTAEIQLLLSRLRSQVHDVPIYAVGVSLGGNALLKWLGESPESATLLINKAVAVSAPIDLAASAKALDTGLNRILYTPRFVDSMRPKALEMQKKFPGLLDEEKIKSARTIHDIDNAVTAVLYGAENAENYYAKNAAKPWLKNISLPTLILNAKNDPFIPAQTLPTPSEVSEFVLLEYPNTGGHVGFTGQNNWFAKRLLTFFEQETSQDNADPKN